MPQRLAILVFAAEGRFGSAVACYRFLFVEACFDVIYSAAQPTQPDVIR